MKYLLLLLLAETLLETVWTRVVPFFAKFEPGKTHPLSDDGECSMELWSLEKQLREIVKPQLEGHWVSGQCEVVPGPRFLLRDYRFYGSGGFLLRDYFYEDIDCTKPKFSFISYGEIRHISKSLPVPGGFESSVTLDHVRVIPYNKRTAKTLTKSLRHHCRLEGDKPFPWPWLEAFRPIQIFQSDNRPMHVRQMTEEIDCLRAANYSISPLKLIQMSQVQMKHRSRTELRLGVSVYDNDLGVSSLPSHFQPPLRNVREVEGCRTCNKVQSSNELNPPTLRARKKNPTSDKFSRELMQVADRLDGQWLSSTCESHSNGIYSHRLLTYTGSSRQWAMKQRFFKDPLCTYPRYTFTTHGKFKVLSSMASFGKDRVFRVSYDIQRVELQPETDETARSVGKSEGCEEQDQDSTGPENDILRDKKGCVSPGIRVPEVLTDIVMLTTASGSDRPFSAPVDQEIQLLFTGDYASKEFSSSTLPTSFQAPLMKCEDFNVVVSVKQNLLEGTGSGNSIVPSNQEQRYLMWKNVSPKISCNIVFLTILCLTCVYFYDSEQ